METDHILNWCEACGNNDIDADTCITCLRTTLSDNDIHIPVPNDFE